VAHSLSAKKRIRQNVKLRARNRARKTIVKSTLRTFDEVVASGDTSKAQEALKAAVKRVDRVAAKGTIHKNTAARKKSQMQRKLNAMKKA
jgi:small subunit ribosomal protein S20